MPEVLRVLLVEDSENDAVLIGRELQHGGFSPTWERVATEQAMSAALRDHSWDVIISDFSLPGFSGAEALALCQQKGLDTPFIVVSGVIGEEIAVRMMKAGAYDYVMKGNLPRLAEAVKRELRAAQERHAGKQAERAAAHLAAIVASCEEAVIGKALDGTVLSWNGGAERLYGYTAAEMIGRSISVLVPASRPGEMPEIYELLKEGHELERLETIRVRKDGAQVEVSLTISPIRDGSGNIVGASSVARDITKRNEEERVRTRLIQELRDSLAHVKTLSGLLPICAGCKKIRNDAGYWEAVETYIKQRSNAEFTHGICPDCAKRLYPEYRLEA